MNYLIFRTDRIGDFLIISPLIKAIKRSIPALKFFSNQKWIIILLKKII